MKKTMRIITILLVAITLITFSTSVFAEEIKPGSLSPSYGEVGSIKTTANKVMGLIRNIAVIAAVLILMVLGVKFMLGSVEEKAEYKKSFMPLIIGIIVVVAATQIATMLFSIAGD